MICCIAKKTEHHMGCADGMYLADILLHCRCHRGDGDAHSFGDKDFITLSGFHLSFSLDSW